MSNGVGSFNNNRKASAFFSSPYANNPFSLVYATPSNKSATAYALLQNGNSLAKRSYNFNVGNIVRRIACDARALYN